MGVCPREGGGTLTEVLHTAFARLEDLQLVFTAGVN
jgi:hypothetical protein